MPSSEGSFLGALDGAECTNGMPHDTGGTGCGVELGFLEAGILCVEAAGLKMGP